MTQKNNFYITTTLPYVNADPHIGHALEFVQADVIARWKRLSCNKEVFFNIGTDEHGQKVFEKAKEEKKDTQEYADYYSDRFKKFADTLNISYTNFIRTTDDYHKVSAQEFWKRCDENGDIYKALQETKYCVGCELEKTDSELEDGCCPLHPTIELEIRTEENYFFRFSKYQDKLLDLYKNNKDFLIPQSRFNEAKSFVERGLQDFSISRLKEKMPWGVSVPGDEDHVMYVWFDALVNYISTIGWPSDMNKFEKWWPVVQIAGKDQVRMQAIMWQAMLLSANIAPSDKIIIHGFIKSGGQKISKSIGNVVNPLDIVGEYDVDTLRYYLVSQISTFEDGDFTHEHLKEIYNGDLANGIGNLTNRILKMATTYETFPDSMDKDIKSNQFNENLQKVDSFMYDYELNRAIGSIWEEVRSIDKYIQETEPFKLIKTDTDKAKQIIRELVLRLWNVAIVLEPFMPNTAIKMQEFISNKQMPETPLFLRKQ